MCAGPELQHRCCPGPEPRAPRRGLIRPRGRGRVWPGRGWSRSPPAWGISLSVRAARPRRSAPPARPCLLRGVNCCYLFIFNETKALVAPRAGRGGGGSERIPRRGQHGRPGVERGLATAPAAAAPDGAGPARRRGLSPGGARGGREVCAQAGGDSP